MLRIFIAANLLWIPQALALTLVPAASLQTKDPQALQNFLQDSSAKLPPKLKNALGKVEVQFVKMQNSRMEGYTNPNRPQITLSQNFLDAISQGPSAEKYRLAQATLLHEVSHQYDYLNQQSAEDLAKLARCRAEDSQRIGPHGTKAPLPAACAEALARNTTISGEPEFLNLAGFPEHGFFSGKRTRGNFLNSRSPDIYERTNAKEAFAVNMEHFLLDPDYQCRRPSLYRYLANYFEFVPFPAANCMATNKVLIQGEGFRALDFSRLYAVDYLFAGPSSNFESRWGHAMLRFVFCAPSRTTMGPECRGDLQDHVVMSFRASMNDFTINMFDGLTGKYQSLLFLMPLLDVVSDYTKTQFREMRSLPLNLNREELKSIYTLMLEMHWSYAGKYRFLTNNCATETMNFLKAALPKSTHARFANAFTAEPNVLYSILTKTGMADASVFDDLKTAEKNFYYFPSRENFYHQQFNALQRFMPIPFANFKQYLQTDASERQQYIQLAVAQKNKGAAAALYIFENLSDKNLHAQILQAAYDAYKKEHVKAPHTTETLNSIKDDIANYASPAGFLNDHQYGVPAAAELELAIGSSDFLAKQKRSDQANKAFRDEMKVFFPKDLMAELAQVKQNRAALYTIIVD